jgi:hypothetical protein
MDLKEIKKEIKNKIIISKEESKIKTGGQSCGIEKLGTILKSEELEIEIKINFFRSQHQNKEYGLILFDLIIDDLVK